MNIKPYILFVCIITALPCVSIAEQSSEYQRQLAQSEQTAITIKAQSEKNAAAIKANSEKIAAAIKANSQQQPAASTKAQLERNAAYTKAELERNAAYTKAELERNAAYTKAQLERNAAYTKAQLEQNASAWSKISELTAASWSKISELSAASWSKISELATPTKQALAPPSLTSCGSKWYHRFGAQLMELEEANRGGYSFEVACQSHDACYGDCRTDRSECDKKLLEDAEEVCKNAKNRSNCIADAQIAYKFVYEKGDTFFRQARANCP